MGYKKLGEDESKFFLAASDILSTALINVPCYKVYSQYCTFQQTLLITLSTHISVWVCAILLLRVLDVGNVH